MWFEYVSISQTDAIHYNTKKLSISVYYTGLVSWKIQNGAQILTEMIQLGLKIIFRP